MTTDLNEYLEDILDDLGGCGRFQFLLTFFVLGTKTVAAWSTLMMSFGGAVPEWSCTWRSAHGELYMPNETFVKKCSIENSTVSVTCVDRRYDSSMSTVVKQWDLVCDREWIISTITTIQMGGLLVGAFISGQVGDIVGRKLTYAISVGILMIGNVAAAFSVNWQMFAALRFFIGLGCGWYLTVFGIYLVELTPRKFRSLVLVLPAWPIGTMLFGLFSWILHDWKYIQIATAVLCVPWIFGFFVITESYRWLVSNKKIDKAFDVTTKIATLNGVDQLSKAKFLKILSASENTTNEKRYTVFHILKDTYLRKITLLTMLGWFSCGYGFYAISFGVEQLSGNLYVNMVLLAVMDLSSTFVSLPANYIGRKWTSVLLFLFAGLTGIAVGVFQFIDIPGKGNLINGFGLTCKLCVASGWYALWILTSEMYPTVVRNVGLGVNNAMSRLGAMIAPQLVFASKRVPGLSYLLLGGLFLLSALFLLCVEETNNKALQSSIEMVIHPEILESTGMKRTKWITTANIIHHCRLMKPILVAAENSLSLLS